MKGRWAWVDCHGRDQIAIVHSFALYRHGATVQSIVLNTCVSYVPRNDCWRPYCLTVSPLKLTPTDGASLTATFGVSHRYVRFHVRERVRLTSHAPRSYRMELRARASFEIASFIFLRVLSMRRANEVVFVRAYVCM